MIDTAYKHFIESYRAKKSTTTLAAVICSVQVFKLNRCVFTNQNKKSKQNIFLTFFSTEKKKSINNESDKNNNFSEAIQAK